MFTSLVYVEHRKASRPGDMKLTPQELPLLLLLLSLLLLLLLSLLLLSSLLSLLLLLLLLLLLSLLLMSFLSFLFYFGNNQQLPVPVDMATRQQFDLSQSSRSLQVVNNPYRVINSFTAKVDT